MKPVKRQARRLPMPESPTLTLTLDTGPVLTLQFAPDMAPRIPGNHPARAYVGDGFLVIVSRSQHQDYGQLLHASISHASGQLPPWYVMKALKQALFPENVAAMIPLPEAQNYTNIAECLHIIQQPAAWGHL